ncbi:MAG: DUF4062 domain-containing protein, partial [Proteobacteria bacterium]|nr:DUF4062 domain-containing protein [Pseudomonadota bacterium]
MAPRQTAAAIDPRLRGARVFVSSTFRDMAEDRDVLVKRVFPKLRKLCADRGVPWSEVDLRWGITDEAVADGQVLRICLDEIDQCRPFFIGLLGERYGFVPDEVPSAVLERNPWLERAAGTSVTELEIAHGVLNDPAMAGRCYFYFRDPAYVDRIAEAARRANFSAESAEAAARLGALKSRIRAAGLPVRENYAGPDALADLVEADLTAAIDA